MSAMEKLSDAQSEKVKKMSDVRLITKLGQAGFSTDQLEAMDRPALLNAMAQLVLSGKDGAPATAAAPVQPMYNVELEKMKLAWEKERFDREQKRLADEKAAEQKQFAEELAFRQAQEQRLADEKAKELSLREQEIRLRDRELARRTEENERPAVRVKLFGDAMRNSAVRMGNDPLDLIPFFENVERLFNSLEVPDDLRVNLLRPYLNEKAKSLLTRLDSHRAGDYDVVKDYLLHQFELSPRVFIDKFNNVSRNSDETMVLFSARLQALLQYYLDSRHVKKFEDFFSLVVCDRMKTTLTDDCLRYVLSVEANTKVGWLGHEELSKVVDTYLANLIKAKPFTSNSNMTGKQVDFVKTDV